MIKTVTENANTGLAGARFAGLGKRLVAFLFDYLLILVYVVALAGVNYGIILSAGALDSVAPFFASPVVKDAIAFLTLVLPVGLYFALQESSRRQSTWGKRKAGIRVVNANGGGLTRKQALLRTAVKLLPWQIAHTSIYHVEGWPLAPEQPMPLVMGGFVLAYASVAIYLLSALLSRVHRTPYDWVSGAYVIVGKP
jgi:uncharacterized RDD family membrane protein YckC